MSDEETEMTDVEIAELANTEIKKRDAEIKELKKELAKAKLYSTAEEYEPVRMSVEDAFSVLQGARTTNYDYAQAVIDICDNYAESGQPNPLGRDGEQVYQFFKDVIEECGGDKSRFCSIYQSRLGADDTGVSIAYNKRSNRR